MNKTLSSKAKVITGLANLCIGLSLIPILVIALLSLENLSLFQVPLLKQPPLLFSALVILVITVLSFILGYSLLLNIILGIPAIIAFTLSVWIQRYSRLKRKRFYKRIWLPLLISLATLFFVMFTLLRTQLDLYLCRKNIGMVLPKSARLHILQPGFTFVGSETEYWIKATMAKEDLPAFLNNVDIGLSQYQVLITGNPAEKVGSPIATYAVKLGWHPERCKKYLVAEWQVRGDDVGTVLVHLDKPHVVTVYIYVFYF